MVKHNYVYCYCMDGERKPDIVLLNISIQIQICESALGIPNQRISARLVSDNASNGHWETGNRVEAFQGKYLAFNEPKFTERLSKPKLVYYSWKSWWFFIWYNMKFEHANCRRTLESTKYTHKIYRYYVIYSSFQFHTIGTAKVVNNKKPVSLTTVAIPD